MISYNELKNIAEEQIFNNFWQLLDYPYCNIIIPAQEQKVLQGNPFKTGSTHVTKLNVENEVINVRCIYNEEKRDVIIGTEYEQFTVLLIYILHKDLPPGFKIKPHYKIKFQGENHNIKNIENIINTIYVLTVD